MESSMSLMLSFEYYRLWIFWIFKYSRLWWSHSCHRCCSLKYLHLWIAWYGKQCTYYHDLCSFLTLLFTFWQKYKSCTSTSGSIISYQVRCKCVTLWQGGLFWSQNVFNYVMLGCLVSGLCYLFICPLNSNRMPISYEMKTSLFQNCVSRKNGDIIDFCVSALIRRIGKRVMEMSR